MEVIQMTNVTPILLIIIERDKLIFILADQAGHVKRMCLVIAGNMILRVRKENNLCILVKRLVKI